MMEGKKRVKTVMICMFWIALFLMGCGSLEHSETEPAEPVSTGEESAAVWDDASYILEELSIPNPDDSAVIRELLEGRDWWVKEEDWQFVDGCIYRFVSLREEVEAEGQAVQSFRGNVLQILSNPYSRWEEYGIDAEGWKEGSVLSPYSMRVETGKILFVLSDLSDQSKTYLGLFTP